MLLDEVSIKELLSILIDNAIKHSYKNSTININLKSNGGTVTLNMTNQKAVGNIVIDSISTLTMNLTNKSYYEGVINSDNSAKSITLKLDKTSSIKLTGDSYITSLDNSDSTNSNIDFNEYKLYVNGKEIKSN